MKNKYSIEHMTWKEFNSRKNDVLIIPIGATEQHGPHLPLNVDSLIAQQFSYKLAEQVGGIVAPLISYGYKSKPQSGGGPLFPGTIDLKGATVQELILDILDEFILDGFTKIFIMNGHFENEAFIAEAMDICSRKSGNNATLLMSNWWDPLPDDAISKIFDEVDFPGWAFEHAAITETSLMLYFAPDLVDMSKAINIPPSIFRPYIKYPVSSDMVHASGLLATAKSSSAEKGKYIADTVIHNLTNIVKSEY